jgi:hypothetical protein
MADQIRALIAAALLASAALLGASSALAFCGFYVAQADAKLFNRASKVVVARNGEQTAVTMASDYQGDPKEFALVIPVPTVVTQAQIKIIDNGVVDHLDAYSAPRLVEYFDPDPCSRQLAGDTTVAFMASASTPVVPPRPNGEALGVKIEAEYTVGEYDILILSATQSAGLVTWLADSGYKIPPGAAPVLGSYIKQNMKFFVARVNLAEQSKLGYQYLRPIQVNYSSAKFMLPIRLGTVNADGPQDMIVLMLTAKGRVETTNYRTMRIPSDAEIPTFVKAGFGNFYRAMFDSQVKRDEMRVVYLEYAWDMSWCDPCAADPLPGEKLAALGAFWVTPAALGGGNVFLTRLHVRYDAAHFPEDLMFQETADRSNFQGRFILRHPYKGQAQCPAGDAYRRSLEARAQREAATLSWLTGWDLPTIAEKTRASAAAPK